MAKRIYAKNKVLLAAAINISRPALYRLFERPDFPKQVAGKGWNIEQWQRYADENIAYWNKREANGKNGGNGHTPTNPRDAAFIRRQEISAEKEQFNLDVQRGRYELKTVTKEQILTHISGLFKELDKAFIHELPPRQDGLSAGEISKLNGKRLRELRERLVDRFEANGNGSASA